jgi:hypothetical protein
MTINEGMIWMRTLRERHAELVALRDRNSAKERHIYGANAERDIVKDPVYDPKQLDRMITVIAREMRLLDTAIKAQNAKTQIDGYVQNDAVLGELA